ncbi:glycerol-3-phosphate acyltransferase [Alkalihalobacillus alcalophilus ATCC 27647 = CGMCC 1.3604]|uniref:Glycerol-3-phosphate acyltransferase n=1 Tax=Alkalihalobacillus alcalophilus ATCC 27647 = CGMCC 1.3604 TaxID=1218173 RepID=A0A094XJH2_ALKAL|nr:glycerol-3-phosphate acyltransferase [Alkalihalobacillus alcalophilus]KGA98910.1 glycerol-3-phosphate acyltransferase 1 [Alkalihalobacillus alcalophilus ATCC 27647 = CGMCC 1.3604]MED1561942.1 glycerol-3-phosphate acyltransferase [Alkalihalobacillus alcalophilus]THG88471.1 glycerol-3-phosphate acyltransferase [Alkalihalobacillus alcalophilus ATCC 27647 = CGMCC 1.3604]
MGYILFAGIISYLFGCLHGSQIVGKIKKVDIKNAGVKNAGASNTTILLGWKYGIIVALIDILKAVIPVVVIQMIASHYGVTKEVMNTLVYLVGFLVVIGHIYPVTMKFNGGKGTASMVGVLLAIDWKLVLIGIITLVLITLISDYLVVGVIAMYAAFVITTIIFDFGTYSILIAILLTLLSVYKHLENYRRIANKTERTISSMIKKKKSA